VATQRRHCRVLDHRFRPHAVEQFVLGDKMPGAINERGQQIEGARAQRNRCAVLQQSSLVGLQLEGAEAVVLWRSGRGHCREGVVSNVKSTPLRRRPCLSCDAVDHHSHAGEQIHIEWPPWPAADDCNGSEAVVRNPAAGAKW